MENKDYLSCAETAKLIRAQFSRVFPGQKFYVRSSVYSGGASIDITWIDGPTEKEVKAVTSAYEGASFDGMVDLKSYNESWLLPDGSATYSDYSQDCCTNIKSVKPHPEARRVHFGADFIFENRKHSPEFALPIIRDILEKYYLLEKLDAFKTRKIWINGKETDNLCIDWDCTQFTIDDPVIREIGHALDDTSAYTPPAKQPARENEQTASPVLPAISSESITVSWDRDWTWIKFPDKPSESVLDLIKNTIGARWSKRRQAWYVMEHVDETTIKIQLAFQ